MGKVLKSRNTSSGDLISFYTDNGFETPDAQSIKGMLANSVISPRYRLNWLNPDESIKEIIPEADILSGGSFSENYQNGQRRSLSLSLFNEMGKYTPSINNIWTNTKFSYDLGVELPLGEIVWFKKGVFSVSQANPTHDPASKVVTLELSDKFSMFEDARGILEKSYTIPTGTPIDEALNDILRFQTGDGNCYDRKPLIYNSAFKNKKTQATISKEAGSTFGEIISELCLQLNAEYFYDVEGNLNIVPINDVTNDVDKPIIDEIYQENGDFGSNNINIDFQGIVNRVYVIGANVDGRMYQATAVNDNPASPICYQRIGFRTASPINDTNITSNILAQDRADYELRNKTIIKSTISTSATLNPFYLVNNILAITDNFYNFKQEKFLIQSLSYSLDYSPNMSITSTNTRNLPFFTARR